jgi:Family of unknown function (DUF6492)
MGGGPLHLLPGPQAISLGLFIKSTLHDLQPYLFLQEDLHKFCRIRGPVIVCVPDAQIGVFRRHVSSGYELVSDSAVARASNIFWPMRDSWYTQQLLKLCACDVLRSDAALILDSNTIINADFDEAMFQINGRWVYEICDANESDLNWERQTWRFMKLMPQKQFGFRTVNQIFVRGELIGLRRYLEDIYRTPWGDLLFASAECDSRLRAVSWTEFQIYGAYVAMRSTSKTHRLGKKNRLAYFNPRLHINQLPDILSQWTEERPFMIKAYRQRPGIRLSESEYADVAAAIRNACRSEGVSVGRTGDS